MKKLSAGSTGQIVAAVVLLWIIVAAGAAMSAWYALGVPPWNNPDEPAHYNYAAQLATTGQLPELKAGDWDSQRLEQLKSTRFPRGEPVDSIRYESHQPPLYYLISAPIYKGTAQLPLGERVVAMRMLSVALAAVTVVLAFFAVRLIFPGDLLIPGATAAFMAFLPMRSSIDGSINNDALAETAAALLILLMVSVLKDGLSRGKAVLLGLGLGVALLTKVTVYGYLLPALLVMALAPAAKGKGAGRSRWRMGLLVLGIALLVSGWWFVRNGMLYGPTDIFGMQRHDQVVVGQPRLERLDGDSLSYLGTTLFKSFWGQFGWMGILMDERVYFALGLVSGLAAFGFALFLWRVVFSKGFLTPHQRGSLALMGLVLAVIVGEVAVFNLTFIQAQGRYLYPALIPIALFFVLGLRELMAPVHAGLLMVLSMGSMVALNLVCLTRYVLPYFK